MLEQTFQHIPGIGRQTEQRLWGEGCTDWDCLLGGLRDYSLGGADKGAVREELERSKQRLAEGDHRYFQKMLGASLAWRAYPTFRSSCAYLDIETDGGGGGQAVTIIGLHDGREFRPFIRGRDLDDFCEAISRYSMIVTFFGAGFDIPMLQRCFRTLRLDQVHLDLCPALRKVGYRGGLKQIERVLGIRRPENVAGLGGLDAVRLWRRYYALGDERSLATLIDYNRADCVNLERLAEVAYDKLRRDARRTAVATV